MGVVGMVVVMVVISELNKQLTQTQNQSPSHSNPTQSELYPLVY